MAELSHLIESLSMDVLLIGLVVSLFIVLSMEIWNHRDRQFRKGFLKDIRIFTRWL